MQPDAAAPLVLVVDDYDDAREMYAESLLASGFRVAEATNGLEAVECARTLAPDVVLMDLSLPGLDGWEATRRLKADERTRHIPVVALTGHVLASALAAARQAGCDRFVIKPALPDVVVEEVRRAIRKPSAGFSQAS
ncbi:MAG TPA: response regulator [Vicinamibacterales bacterium]|nr:response regulator [Vicinamibacterales bacterium]